VTVFVLTFLALTSLSEWKALQCTGEPVIDRYVNYAEGFSVAIPAGLQGRRGQVVGPERGVSIPLSADCVGVVVLFGEPNSADWATAADAVAATVRYALADNEVAVQRYRTKMGPLAAAGATIRYRGTSDVEDVVIAFRPGGGPVYTARLATTNIRYQRDHRRFVDVLRGFRLEAWR
jgi:hypothetical protein